MIIHDPSIRRVNYIMHHEHHRSSLPRFVLFDSENRQDVPIISYKLVILKPIAVLSYNVLNFIPKVVLDPVVAIQMGVSLRIDLLNFIVK